MIVTTVQSSFYETLKETGGNPLSREEVRTWMHTLDRAILNSTRPDGTRERRERISHLEIFHYIFLFLGVKFFLRIFYL